MKKTLSGLAAALALGLCAPAGAASTIGSGPYYALPSWDQTLPAVSRFLVLANFNQEAVLDRETGLVWQRSVLPSVWGFAEAEVQCRQSRVGGRLGWRLPAAHELSSLFDPSATELPYLPAGHPFVNVPGATGLWSGTLATVDPGQVFIVIFAPSVQVTTLPRNLGFGQAWCVRGPA